MLNKIYDEVNLTLPHSCIGQVFQEYRIRETYDEDDVYFAAPVLKVYVVNWSFPFSSSNCQKNEFKFDIFMTSFNS